MIQSIVALTGANLAALAKSLRSGSLSSSITVTKIRDVIHHNAEAVHEYLISLQRNGFSSKQIAVLIESILAERKAAMEKGAIPQLVLTGPSIAGVPTKSTNATVQSLFQEATNEVLIVGYAFQNAANIFKPLMLKMTENAYLSVTICLNIERKKRDTSLDSEIVKRYTKDFWENNWPWEPKPSVFYDPRSLETDTTKRASLHAKCVVIDRKTALITSANFTEYAQERNIEVGVLTRCIPLAEQLAGYFEGLIAERVLLPLI